MAAGRHAERNAAYAFVAPTVLCLVVVAAYPIAAMIYLSLRRRFLIFGIDEFYGLRNFSFLLRDLRFWNALGNTAYFTALSVGIELGLGLLVALLLRRTFLGRGLLRTAILVPWAIPTVVSAKMWAWLLSPEFGLISYLLRRPDINWLGTPILALHAAILVDVWKTTPFVALLLLAGLQQIPDDLYRAARIDGASALRSFREITLPLLLPTLLVTLLFRTLDAFRVFDAVYVLTGGGPANTTETLSIYAYKVLFQTLQFGYGATLSLATFACVLGISTVYIRLLSRGEVFS